MPVATGSAWGCYAILMPIALPLAVQAGLPIPLVLAAVLSGGIFGDHASPISDTTIMSSMSSGSDHVDHVRTQMPYAIVVAVVAIRVGYLPIGFGCNPFLSLILGSLLLAVLIFILGKKTD